jgi:hypothetical protein
MPDTCNHQWKADPEDRQFEECGLRGHPARAHDLPRVWWPTLDRRDARRPL